MSSGEICEAYDHEREYEPKERFRKEILEAGESLFLGYRFLESLILAQDERWRRA